MNPQEQQESRKTPVLGGGGSGPAHDYRVQDPTKAPVTVLALCSRLRICPTRSLPMVDLSRETTNLLPLGEGDEPGSRRVPTSMLEPLSDPDLDDRGTRWLSCPDARRSGSADRTGRLHQHLVRRGEVTALREATVNGTAELVVEVDGGMPLVLHDGRITRVYLLLNGDKFGGLSAHPAIT